MGWLTRAPFPALVAAGTALAGVLGWWARPDRPAVAAGAALGAGVAGGFAALAVATFRRIRARGGPEAGSRLVNAFIGLMLVRMVGYLTFLGMAVALKAGDPLSVCLGLVGGTIVFQGIEILHLRSMT